MKVGDLVKMKTMMFWAAKNNKHFTYTDKPGVVIAVGATDSPYEVITVLVGGTQHRGMATEWEHIK